MTNKTKIYGITSKIGRTVLFYAFTNKWKKVSKITIEFNNLNEEGEEITFEKLKANLKTYFEKTVADGVVIEVLQSTTNKWAVLEVLGE